jgi:hypothetical protein
MSLLLIFVTPSTPVTAGIDFQLILAELYPKLNATDATDLVYWTDAELYQWADEAAKRLARKFGVFVERDASTTIVLGTAIYNLPARHISTIHASIAGAALYPNNVQELEALDSDWVRTAGATDSFLNDNEGTATIRVYPTPDATITGSLALIFHRFPVTIAAGTFELVVPLALQEYFTWLMLAEARRKESDASMPEVADHFAARVDLMESVIRSYWGDSQ